MAHLKEDMSVFGMKFEGWRKAAQKAGRWFRQVEEGAELFMRDWHETERREASERHAKAAAALFTIGISIRPGRGWGWGAGGGASLDILVGTSHAVAMGRSLICSHCFIIKEHYINKNVIQSKNWIR